MSLPEYVYHTTFLRNVEGIVEEGLVPSGGSQFGGGYSGHSTGRVFVSDFDGVYFWCSKMEDIANASSDFRADDEPEEVFGWSPVVLRMQESDLPEDPQEDVLGMRDSGGNGAWYVTQATTVGALEIYDGRAWVPLEDVDIERMYDRAEGAATLESEEGDDDEGMDEVFDEDADVPDDAYYMLDFDLFRPTSP